MKTHTIILFLSFLSISVISMISGQLIQYGNSLVYGSVAEYVPGANIGYNLPEVSNLKRQYLEGQFGYVTNQDVKSITEETGEINPANIRNFILMQNSRKVENNIMQGMWNKNEERYIFAGETQ